MGNIQYKTSYGLSRASFGDEFLCHKNGSEWWYCTGYLTTEENKLFSFQFTIARARIYGIRVFILMTAVTDFETQKHYYAQKPLLFSKNVTLTAEKVGLKDIAEMVFHHEEINLSMTDKEYGLSLQLTPAKERVWHCDDGYLKMGLDRPKEYTFYWSYTNLAASGTLKLGDREFKVTGKGWFDKQGGPYTLTSRWTCWEWFSMRFFDDEEVMLFTFPQDKYYDGTFIEKSGKYRRLNDYAITPTGFTESGGFKFAFGWQVTMKGIKEEQYTIIPKIEGQLNLFYYELLADIVNKDGKTVGYCMVELLPGVYNELKNSAAFKRVGS